MILLPLQQIWFLWSCNKSFNCYLFWSDGAYTYTPFLANPKKFSGFEDNNWRASLQWSSGMNRHPSSVNTPICFVLECSSSQSWWTERRLWCIFSTCRALMFNCPSLWSLIDPSDVAVIISPNAGVIGTLHVDRHDSRFLLPSSRVD